MAPEQGGSTAKHTKVVRVEGRGIPIRGNDVDTDRIIPARFMKVVTFDGLGEYAFYDQRYDAEGNEKLHPFNDPRFQGANILLVNANFGCGSSREHAPQALARWGIEAVVGESFAEIFAGNCTAMGVPAVSIPHEDVEALIDRVEEYPETQIAIDVREGTIVAEDLAFEFELSPASRSALIAGTWDSTSTLLSNLDQIRETAGRLPYMTGYPA
ncbi:MAG: 3-isopropylmalate dehydratase small subunit [Spirochaetaceae bacterium]